MKEIKKHLNFKDRNGEKFITNEGYEVEIIEYFGVRNCTIQFSDGLVLENIIYNSLKKGNVKNPHHPSICGIGYNGVGKYVSTINGNRFSVYTVWSHMILRCYDEKIRHKFPTYENVTVCEEWHNFQNYAKWYYENYKEGFDVDKDLLFKGNRVYSPKTCAFIPKEINQILIKSNYKRKESLPLGVTKHCKKFRIRYCDTRKMSNVIDTAEEAFNIYKLSKESYIKSLAEKWKIFITEECYKALINYTVDRT